MKKLFTVSATGFIVVLLMSFTPVMPVHFHTAIGETSHTIKVYWEKDSHDFGTIEQGKPVSVEFAFTNNGDEALLIADVVVSCGCTASDYPKNPVMPGKSSSIKVTFNAAVKGSFSKNISIQTNDPAGNKVLQIKGTVL